MNHKWNMTRRDLQDLLNEKAMDLNTWVEKFLGGKLNYGAKLQFYKLKAEELQESWIEFFYLNVKNYLNQN